ncbi:hypothetical protein PDJAM_G00022070 [Pangasius djambal]|uniref:Uncharacterized protein n=1 Tax=Pangasius djambal TaxID=1691987 RepID=A0ACC5YPA9_9TELE|nr:hypothetical protein [Pangasius djambal]
MVMSVDQPPNYLSLDDMSQSNGSGRLSERRWGTELILKTPPVVVCLFYPLRNANSISVWAWLARRGSTSLHRLRLHIGRGYRQRTDRNLKTEITLSSLTGVC